MKILLILQFSRDINPIHRDKFLQTKKDLRIVLQGLFAVSVFSARRIC